MLESCLSLDPAAVIRVESILNAGVSAERALLCASKAARVPRLAAKP
jgi:hypothetical protein